MKQQKLYFKNLDDEHCYPLEHFTEDYDLDKITLYVAKIDLNPNFLWCNHYKAIARGEDCKKSLCNFYTSMNYNGTGLCKHRGKLYDKGEKVTIKLKNLEKQ